VFCTVAEGIKGKRAKEWGLVDHLVPRSSWDKVAAERAKAIAAKQTVTRGPALKLGALSPKVTDGSIKYNFVELTFDRAERTGNLLVMGPEWSEDWDKVAASGHEPWALRAFRELDDALLRLRFDLPEIGMVTVRTKGQIGSVREHDEALAKSTSGLAREIRLFQRRVLKRFDNTARSLFAVADDPSSLFEGVLLELALGADRFYALIDKAEKVAVRTSVANAGFMTMSSGLSRLEAKFYGEPARVQKILARGAEGDIASEEAEQLGIATIAADDIDFEDELRIAVEERASLSPDALTGMEASLRFVGPETLETKIFGRLSAWQNWIFTRANSTGEQGALTLYGRPERPQFQWKRT
jgi:benzoyl-CoA-dihydrodiol lyase